MFQFFALAFSPYVPIAVAQGIYQYVNPTHQQAEIKAAFSATKEANAVYPNTVTSLLFTNQSQPNSTPSRGSFRAMLEALGAFESGLPSGDPKQYKVINTLGFMGKYQFGEALLIDLGYYKTPKPYIDGGNGVDKNYWRGTWTGKKGINSKAKFLNSPAVQESAIREAFALNLKRVNDTLAGQRKSLKDYLGKTKTFNDNGVSKTVTITLSGILAGAHLRGPYGVANLLLKNQVSHDEFGTSILRYMKDYGGYNVKPADFS